MIFVLLSLQIIASDIGMGVVSVSTSSSGIPLGSNSTPSRNLNRQSPVRRPVFLAFKIEKRKNKSFSKKQEPISLGIDSVKDPNPSVKRVYTDSKRVNAVCVDQAPSTLDLDYDEVAAALENLYKLSPKDISDQVAEKCIGRKKITKNDKKKPKRLGLSERIMLMKKKSEGSVGIKEEREEGKRDREKLDRLVRDYSVSTDLVSLDWKKMKIPAVLSSSEHTFLFKLMQPVKVSFVLPIILLIEGVDSILFCNLRPHLKFWIHCKRIWEENRQMENWPVP